LVTVATMIPAAAVATPMPIMLRAPAISPSRRSTSPAMNWAPISAPWPRIHAFSGRWVTMMNSISAVA
jgi:hypothetical protein